MDGALAEYTDNYLAEGAERCGLGMKPVPWLLEISTKGTFLNPVDRMTAAVRGKKQVQVPMHLGVPHSPVNRNSGHHPLLGVDDISYVLGLGSWTPDKAADQEKTKKHHAAFVTLID